VSALASVDAPCSKTSTLKYLPVNLWQLSAAADVARVLSSGQSLVWKCRKTEPLFWARLQGKTASRTFGSCSRIPNVMLGLEPALIPQARKVLAQVGLAERANDWPATLSGGQRQRVALARALVHDPNLLLLDEPLGSLDALTRIEMQRLIEDVWRSRGFTAMLVTHDVAEAISLADRVILIEGGHVALDEVVNIPRPRTRASARFAALEERILDRVLQRRPLIKDQW
jgi:ABC-type multidrug transport system ATPase subunit